ncbi:uncharacterized protein BX664DRAFT_320241 [Halteromyces radiatus]|uniref:uncharacterized protein n=1 Tax=Halteromyces radiatus TaxID=101107 RepID=UPI00221E4A14|nr:uncharacterized protein BX664DRAFT_320241 [Halteromyces radiatus]KAI8099038.1 hypothetical protein BX664DRAFT_320241 [Halteromyces radiatus]
MNRRFQNLNKYRNSVGTISNKEVWYADIPVTSSSSDLSSLIQANTSWLAIKWGSGSIGLLPVDRPGKNCATEARVFHAHGASISDWHFSPFDDYLLATGAEDSMIKLWQIPDKDDTLDPVCLSTLTTPSRRIDMIRFHPTADQILTTLGNDGKKVCIWDIEKSSCTIDLLDTTPIHSFSWKSDGSLLATTGKDVMQIWDPRAQEKQIQAGKGHEGIKGSRVVWLGDSNYVFTVGMNKMRSRQYAVFDSRDVSKPLMMNPLDTSTGNLLPLYDEDTETMYLLSRGDATIRSLQFSDLGTTPTVAENMACGTNASLLGGTLLPKRTLDVMHTEVARLIAVTDNALIPVSYQVPRKQYIDFHADLFPDTKGNVPALSSAEWFAGKTGKVATISLDPSRKQASPSISTPNIKATSDRTSNKLTDQPTLTSSCATDDQQKNGHLTSQTPASASNAESIVSNDSTNDQQKLSHHEETKPTPSSDSIKNVKDHPNITNTTTPTTNTSIVTDTTGITKKKLPRYGTTNTSTYKYINSKTYHPSTHYDDLKGLDSKRSSTTEVIQANDKFIAVPLTGPGGRIGVISTMTCRGGRLPIHIPSVLTGSEITCFQFNPFDPYILTVASEDSKIRVFYLPENGLEDDLSEPMVILQDPHMDKISLLSYHPTSKNVLATASQDLHQPTIRIWDTTSSSSPKLILQGVHTEPILAMAWRPDGKAIATVSADKQLRIVDARTGELLGSTRKAHEGNRPSRLVWLDDHQYLVSVGFGLGSMREILLFDTLDMSGTILSKNAIDVSPSVMSIHFDHDCRVLYAAGKGDRIIHCYEFENNTVLTPLAKLEFGSLQQGFAFLPKRLCNIKTLEIAKFYRLTPTTIEPVGVHVPRARPEYFQDDVFIPTLDIEHAAQEAEAWFQGKDHGLQRISLQPDDMTPLSKAPPAEQVNRSREKFESGKRQVSLDQQRQETMNRMFATAKDVDQEDERQRQKENQLVLEQDVDEDEWDD